MSHHSIGILIRLDNLTRHAISHLGTTTQFSHNCPRDAQGRLCFLDGHIHLLGSSQVMIIQQPKQFAHNFLPDTQDCVYSSGLFSEGNLGSPSDNVLKNVISTFFRFSELRSFSWWRHSLTGLSSEDCSGQLCKTYKSLPPGVVQYFRESSWSLHHQCWVREIRKLAQYGGDKVWAHISIRPIWQFGILKWHFKALDCHLVLFIRKFKTSILPIFI